MCANWIILFFTSIISSAALAGDHCYSDVVGACSPTGGDMTNCNAKYGHFSGTMKSLQDYANVHIIRSFQFLLMSIHFRNFETQREGLAGLYRQYSDKTWEDGIDLIKYITKRGGNADFFYKKDTSQSAKIENYEMPEIHSLSKALDIWKTIADQAHFIHGEAARRREPLHDPEVASYIENNFVHKHARIIRELAGHSNDLKRMLADASDPSLALFLFDNILKD